MRDETIPAPLMHRSKPEPPTAQPAFRMAPRWIAAGIFLLCVIAVLMH